MFQYTIRCDTVVDSSSKTFKRFPFDSHVCQWKFELSHFKVKHNGKPTDFRFDVYTAPNALSWKENVGMLPEFEISYETGKLYIFQEKKEEKKKGGEEGEKLVEYYYPGVVFKFFIARDPQ